MKSKVKIIIVMAAIVAAMVSASAQPGIEAGYLNSRYNYEKDGVSKTGTPLNGFYVGVSDEVNLVAGLGIHIGLNYSYAVDKTAEAIVEDRNLKGSETDQYLNLPLRLRYSFNVLPGVLKIQVFGGPVFSVGLSHTYRYDFTADIPAIGTQIKGDIKYNYYTGKVKSDSFSDEDLEALNAYLPEGRYNRFDIAAGGGLGVELFNFLELKAGYDWGLMNRYKEDYAAGAVCNRDMFYFTLGFRF